MVLATKSKNSKYSPWVKALCLFIGAAMIFLSGTCLAHAVTLVRFFGTEAVKDNAKNSVKPEFSQTEAVRLYIQDTAAQIESLTGADGAVISQELSKNRESYVSEALNKYLDEKARIIKNELTYVAKNYKTDAYAYSAYGLSSNYSYNIPDTDAADQKYPVDPYAPKVVQTVQKILNYADGREFLKYENLVRETAFTEGGFSFSKKYYVNGEAFDIYIRNENLLNDAETEKDFLESEFDSSVENKAYKADSEKSNAQAKLEKTVNLKYYARKGDKVATNMADPDAELAAVATHKAYYFRGEDGYITEGFDLGDDYLSSCDTAAFYIADGIEQGDEIGSLYDIYNGTKSANIFPDAILMLVSFILAVSALVCLLNLSGHKIGEDGIALSFIDKIPGDIHTVISGGIIAAICYAFFLLADYAVIREDAEVLLYAKKWVYLVFGSVLAALWLVLAEWLCSLARIKKHSGSWVKTFIIYKALAWLFKKIKKFFSLAGGIIKYKPGSFGKNKYRIFLAAVLLFNIISVLLAVNFRTWPLWACCLAVMDICAFCTARIFKDLDKVIVAAQKRTCAEFGGERVPEFIETLNDSLRVTNAEMQQAVAEAVKNERTKAELITNVSHDLKTPLTSIISYVDLLKKCDIKDEDALKYINVLDEKSQNLKSLIENLVEASKVSTGNVKLNKTILNLKELAVQAVVEYSPEFESRNLDLRLNEEGEAVNILADGPHTYRILENLLSNAKKYSAPGSRVYVHVYKQGENGVFEIKNISKAPLDISPEELTERFVRGDASRGEEEGNGLGLSIAKELCSLQGGKLVISIDGDLFKATVILPSR